MADLVTGYLQSLVNSGKTPGVQYARAESGGAVQTYAAGWADPKLSRPMTTQTMQMAYSMSKVLTAHALYLLARQGALALDDPIARYLTDQPYGDEVTIRHLLEHRSGIPNPLPLRWVHLASEHRDFDEPAALRAVLEQHPRLRFRPGTKRLYSNIGYWLLGAVVERASRQPFASFVEQEILRSNGISKEEISYQIPNPESAATGYLERYSLLNLLRPFVTDRRLSGEAIGPWREIQPHYVNGPAFGGAFGTAAGFCKLGQLLLACPDHNYGWSDRPDVIQKEGGGAGFHCLLRLNTRRKSVEVILSNATAFPVKRAMDQLAGSDATAPEPNQAAFHNSNANAQ